MAALLTTLDERMWDGRTLVIDNGDLQLPAPYGRFRAPAAVDIGGMRMRAGHLPLTLVSACLALLLGGCDIGLGTRGGHVGNRTSQDLIVEVVGAADSHRGEVSAQAGAQWDARGGECLGTGVALYTPNGQLLTTLGERICDGRSLIIDDDDLPPAEQ